MRKRGQGFEDPRVRVIKAMYDVNTIFVILSEAKDLFQGKDEILSAPADPLGRTLRSE